jgi:hypothetical protein
MDENELIHMKCYHHAIPKNEYKLVFKEDNIRNIPDQEIKIYKNDKNDKLMKVTSCSCDFLLIRDRNDKIDVWRFHKDFNYKSAVSFMSDWDEDFLPESTISMYEAIDIITGEFEEGYRYNKEKKLIEKYV